MDKIERAFATLNAAAERGTPSSSCGRWWLRDVCPLGPLRLGTRLAATTSSNIYIADIVDRTDRAMRNVVVKHMNDCRSRQDEGLDVIHPLLTDAVYLSVLAPTGLVPGFIYLSPPTVLPGHGLLPERVLTKAIERQRDRCTRENTETRFLVQERMGVEIGAYLRDLGLVVPWRVMAHRAVSLIIRVIQMLETIHSLGIVHGDIHGGNILFRDIADVPEMEDTELVLIDFEFAVFYPMEIGAPVNRSRLARLSRRLLSPWHLQGYRIGRRDDVFRVLELLADVLSQGVYYATLREQIAREKNVTDDFIAELKEPMYLFYGIFQESYGGGIQDGIRTHLDRLADKHLGGLTHPDDRPDYDGIVDHLGAVREMLSSH